MQTDQACERRENSKGVRAAEEIAEYFLELAQIRDHEGPSKILMSLARLAASNSISGITMSWRMRDDGQNRIVLEIIDRNERIRIKSRPGKITVADLTQIG